MYKVYFNKELIKDWPWTSFLTPILGIYKYKGKGTIGTEYLYYDENQLKERNTEGKKIISYSDINECDFCVWPRNYYIDDFHELKVEAKIAKKYNKKIVVFSDTDIETPIPYIENIIVFRTSLTKESPKYEYSLPDFVSPLNFTTLGKNNKGLISIGYVGYGGKASLKLIIWDKIRNMKIFCEVFNKIVYSKVFYKFLKHLDKYCIEPHIKINSLVFQLLQRGKGSIVRGKVIEMLKKCKYRFNYIERDNVLNPKVVGDLRKQYIDNIENSMFTMVARGHGNHAYRLYETLSVGKIPLFIDTKCRLPLENMINYRDLFLRVPYEDIKNIEKYIDKYYEKNSQKLHDIEQNIYKLYNTYLTMLGFYKNAISHIILKGVYK